MSPVRGCPVILLVDDDENDRTFFDRAIRKLGYPWRIASVTSGREAVDYLSGSKGFADRDSYPAPTHVLLDLKLPEVSGLEVLRWIRTHPTLATLPVIVLSSSRQPSDLERARALGIDAYEVKPVEFRALLLTIRSIAGAWRLEAAPV